MLVGQYLLGISSGKQQIDYNIWLHFKYWIEFQTQVLYTIHALDQSAILCGVVKIVWDRACIQTGLYFEI